MRCVSPCYARTSQARPPSYHASMASTDEASQPLTIRLPADLYERLRQTAFDQRTSMNALVIQAIQNHLNA